MKTKAKVVYDSSWGLGPAFYCRDVELTEKMVDIGICKHRRSGFVMALATPELIAEAKAIKVENDSLRARASAFREILRNSPQP